MIKIKIKTMTKSRLKSDLWYADSSFICQRMRLSQQQRHLLLKAWTSLTLKVMLPKETIFSPDIWSYLKKKNHPWSEIVNLWSLASLDSKSQKVVCLKHFQNDTKMFSMLGVSINVAYHRYECPLGQKLVVIWTSCDEMIVQET